MLLLKKARYDSPAPEQEVEGFNFSDVESGKCRAISQYAYMHADELCLPLVKVENTVLYDNTTFLLF